MGERTGTPGASLRPYVRGVHAYDLTGASPGTHVGMPSPSLTLVLPVDQRLVAGAPGEQPRAVTSCVGGLHDRPVLIHHDGTQRGVQLALSPRGARALLGVPPAELAGRLVTLDDLFGEAATGRLLDDLHCARDWPARRAVVESALRRRLGSGNAGEPPWQVRRAWRLLVASGGLLPVHRVAAEVGWTPRHLTERFTAEVGLGPKRLARVARFGRSVALVRRGVPLAEVAARTGYADQAHLTRDWARLAGAPPARWRREDGLANVQDGAPAPR
ncbi:AraC family transcriptional regulator [Frankia sp. CNm7]|uniref:AraC family transcriptional regulator n=1 Tax=Frankia nepalensis TaxID=1836974 RepID=A0A937RIQ4_9ACTN|nr:helix-turn-helix domain-containing protein [Frankia nepalensis]MBL7497622.1 AraC family transcriptional regulator [Frankia nepalensis]MBL7510064.1 AraC family transcriptional regulator [Frankia nepalensis]MBL7519064.1 AraC family transcriptional regulator [Frankia nepalensis]MBL7631085.1 AraC family transcriptional regulator [Frankia nepalensis]